MANRRVSIGDVLIVPAERTNPYGGSLLGEPRRTALWQFHDGTLPSSLRAWYGPASGGARILTDPADVDWSGMSPRGVQS